MLRKLLPVLMALVGLAGGAGAGLFLRPAPEAAAEGATAETAHGEAAAPAEGEHAEEAPLGEEQSAPEGEEGDETLPEYVKLNNQFVVPLLEKGEVTSMVILSLSLEVAPGGGETIYQREPKIRDAFLQILFDHANAGGFRGSFTDGANLILLRKALLEKAKSLLGETVTDVLISDIARQDA